MPKLQHTHVAREPDESSVLFNLRDLMRMETERIAADEAAARAAVAHTAQARAERERAAREAIERKASAARAREQDAREAEAARLRQHEAALLRIRIEASARERAESERLALEHERALRQLERDARRGHFTRALGVMMVLVTIAGIAGYMLIVRPSLRAAEAQARAAASARPREMEALREALARLEHERTLTAASRQSLPKQAEAALSPVTPDPHKPLAARNPKLVRPVRKPVAAATFITIDQLGDGDDPLDGLPEVDTTRKPRGLRRSPRRRSSSAASSARRAAKPWPSGAVRRNARSRPSICKTLTTEAQGFHRPAMRNTESASAVTHGFMRILLVPPQST